MWYEMPRPRGDGEVCFQMRVLVCDDMAADAARLVGLLRGSERVSDVAVFWSAQAALEHVLSGARVDVCFLDIIMPEMSGVALADGLRAGGYVGEIVFLTTANDFAHESYRVQAFDYLLKPPTAERVGAVLQRLTDALQSEDRAGIAVKTAAGTELVRLRDISYVEAINHFVCIRLTSGKEKRVRATFSDVAEQLLRDRRFIRCHRSFVVNMSGIEALTDLDIQMKGGALIPISRGYSHVRDELVKWMFGRDVR